MTTPPVPLKPKPIPVVTGTAVNAPRWPRGKRFVFAAQPGGLDAPPGTIGVWVEMGSSSPFVLEGGWGSVLSPNLASKATVDAVLDKIAAAKPAMVAWDFEHLDWMLESTTRFHLTLIDGLRERDPGILHTVYDVPRSDYWAFLGNAAGLANLRATNDRLGYGEASTGRRYPDRGLIAACDCLSFRAYTEYPDSNQLAAGMTQEQFLPYDAAYLNGNLDEFDRVGQGKPVLGWLSTTVQQTGQPVAQSRIDQALAIFARRGVHPCCFNGGGPSRDGLLASMLASVA